MSRYTIPILISITLILSYILLNGEDVKLDRNSDFVAKSPDKFSFLKLPEGEVHYQLVGNPDGQVVILTHGVSGPMMVWDKLVDPLVKAGYRVLRYDLYGRGFSDRINTKYNLDLYLRELGGLIDQLKLKEPVDLVGSSMGAIISSEFTVRNPQRVRKTALIGPAGFQLQANPLARLMTLPVIGEYLMGVVGTRVLENHNRNYFYEPERFGEFQERFNNQLRVKGSKQAILSTYRSTPLQSYLPGYQKLGALGRKVLVVWGKEDRAFPFENSNKAQNALKSVTFVPVAKAGHLPQYETPDQVITSLIDYLKP